LNVGGRVGGRKTGRRAGIHTTLRYCGPDYAYGYRCYTRGDVARYQRGSPPVTPRTADGHLRLAPCLCLAHLFISAGGTAGVYLRIPPRGTVCARSTGAGCIRTTAVFHLARGSAGRRVAGLEGYTGNLRLSPKQQQRAITTTVAVSFMQTSWLNASRGRLAGASVARRVRDVAAAARLCRPSGRRDRRNALCAGYAHYTCVAV